MKKHTGKIEAKLGPQENEHLEGPNADAEDVKQEEGALHDSGAEMDLHHVKMVHQIMSSPERMAKVHGLAGRHLKQVQEVLKPTNNKKPKVSSIDDLHKVYQEKYGQGKVKPVKGGGGA